MDSLTPSELIFGAGGDIRTGAAEEALQPGLAGVTEVTEPEDIFDRIQHRIVVEGNVGHGSWLEERRQQHAADAIATEARSADEEVGRAAISVLKPEGQRLTVGDQRPDVGSRLLTAAAGALIGNGIKRPTVDRSNVKAALVERNDQQTVFLECGRVGD